ncbi:MAG: hypothetical protein ACPG61_11955, partial [Paracoccaceae bacterium]
MAYFDCFLEPDFLVLGFFPDDLDLAFALVFTLSALADFDLPLSALDLSFLTFSLAALSPLPLPPFFLSDFALDLDFDVLSALESFLSSAFLAALPFLAEAFFFAAAGSG